MVTGLQQPHCSSVEMGIGCGHKLRAKTCISWVVILLLAMTADTLNTFLALSTPGSLSALAACPNPAGWRQWCVCWLSQEWDAIFQGRWMCRAQKPRTKPGLCWWDQHRSKRWKVPYKSHGSKCRFQLFEIYYFVFRKKDHTDRFKQSLNKFRKTLTVGTMIAIMLCPFSFGLIIRTKYFSCLLYYYYFFFKNNSWSSSEQSWLALQYGSYSGNISKGCNTD